MQRFAITHINSTGLRTLTFANQGRNHYATYAEAEEAMRMYEPELPKVLMGRADTLEVREVECYENGDAKGIYFDDIRDSCEGCSDFKALPGSKYCGSCQDTIREEGRQEDPAKTHGRMG